ERKVNEIAKEREGDCSDEIANVFALRTLSLHGGRRYRRRIDAIGACLEADALLAVSSLLIVAVLDHFPGGHCDDSILVLEWLPRSTSLRCAPMWPAYLPPSSSDQQ
ncbi:hypothetical protein EJB05_49704, partial [Eragrostis curvula]